MEILLGLFGIALFFAPFILSLINHSKLSTLTRRLERLELTNIGQTNAIEELRKAATERRSDVQSASVLETKPPVKAEQPLSALSPSEPVIEFPNDPGQQSLEPEIRPIDVTAPVASVPVIPRAMFQPSDSPFAKKSRTNKEWEALIGGKVLNRIGALALIIGMGFFLKYAFDNDLISETMRVILGGLAGGGLLFVAAHMHKKHFEVFSQGLVGAGISILYLSVYAAFNFYHIIPQLAAFVLMSGVTMITLWQSLKYDSLAVAVLGWAGGFLTPFMLSTGQANEVGLFTYVALLDAGLLAIIISKEKWIVLQPLTLGATYFLYFVGMHKENALAPTIFFLTVFWILFFGVEAFRNLKRKSSEAFVLRQVLAVANGLLYFVGMYQAIEPNHHAWMGFVSLLIGIPYFVMFLLLKRSGEENESLLSVNVLGALTLMFSATAIQFEGFTTVIVWSLEAVAVVYAGSKWSMKSVWIAAVVMFAFAFVKLLFSDGSLSFIPLDEFRLMFNMRALSYVVLGAMLLASSELFRLSDESIARRFNIVVSYSWCIVLFVFLSAETNDLFSRWMLYVEGEARSFLSFKRYLTLAMVWMAYSAGLSYFGFRRNALPVLYSGIVILALALLVGGLRSVTFEPIQQYTFILNYRLLTIVFLVAGTIAHVLMWRKYGATVTRSNGVLGAITVSIVLLIFILLTAETNDGFEKLLLGAAGTASDQLSFKRVLTLALVWTAYSLLLTWFGLTKKHRSVVYCGIGAMGLGLFVGLFRSMWFEPVESFSIVLNFRFFSMCVLVAGAVLQLLLWRRNSGEISWSKNITGGISLMIVALVLVLLTSEARDFFEHKINAVQQSMTETWNRDLETQLSSLRNMQQLSLSCVWLLYSIVLMVVGIWKRHRHLRLVAIGLFGITILKIFIYDLSFLQTLYRIISFMGLGVILLGVSYLYQKYKSIILDVENEETTDSSPPKGSKVITE